VKFGSVCSGIEAASVAWEPIGWKAAWFAEIEPFPSAVLAHRFPEVENLGDMTAIAKRVLTGSIAAPDVLTGGTPCQAFSVAGMREGLNDPRGALTIKFVELADAIDHVRAQRGEAASIVIWENVPGVLSDKGNAFGCFLGALAGEDCELQPSGKRWTDAGCVYGPKRAIAWRVLDAQYFGLAQRRRRVFVVASAREGFDPASVLFEREGVRRDTPPRRGEGQDAAAGTLRSTQGGSDVDHARAGHLIAFGGNNQAGPIDVATACRAKGGTGHGDFESETFVVAGTLQANGKAAGSATQQDAESGLLVVHGTQDPDVRLDQAHTLGRNNGMENALLAFSCKDHGEDAGQISPTLRAIGHGGSHANAGGQVAVCVTGDIAHTLKAEGFDASEDGTGRGQPIVPVAFTQNSRSEVRQINGDGQIVGALAAEAGAQQQNYLSVGSAVRRLTPTECERLQGFPEIRKTFTMSVSFDGGADECSGHQKSSARAEAKSLRSQSNALHAEESEFLSCASTAERSLSADLESSSEHVLVSVLIDSERQHLQIRSAGKLLLSVSTAEQSEWCHIPISRADFAQLIARMHMFEEIATHAGGEAEQQSTICSTHRQSGNVRAQLSGREIGELVNDAERFTSDLRDCLKFTTSAVEQSSQSYDLSRKTLFSCVAAVICSCIPGQIQSGSSFEISIETVAGWTLIPWRGKPAEECPDGPRYKAIGNSWAVPVARWVGERVQRAVEVLQ